MKIIKRYWFWLIMLAAALVRLPQISVPLWFDEAWTAWISSLPFERMLDALAGDVHPPLFFLMEWVVGRWNVSPVAMRLLPLCFGLVSIWLVRELARQLQLDTAAQVAAALLMAFAPYQMYYSIEARAYSLLECLYLLQLLAGLRRNWWVFGVISAAMLYTHNYGFVYSATSGLLFLELEWSKRDWRAVVAVAGAGAAALGAYLPWAGVLAAQVEHIREGWWAVPPSLYDIAMTFSGFLFGDFPGIRALLCVTAGVALVVLAYLKAQRCKLQILPYTVFAPISLAVLLSYIWQPIYIDRVFIGVGAIYCLLIGWAITYQVDWYKRAWVAVMLLPLCAISSTADTSRAQMGERMYAPQVAAIIRAQAAPGDVVYHTNLTSIVELHQFNLAAPQYLYPFPDAGLNRGGYTLQTRRALGVQETTLAELGAPRAWLVRNIQPGVDDAWILNGLLYGHSAELIWRQMDRHNLFGVEVYLWQP